MAADRRAVVVAVARDPVEAAIWVDALRSEGIEAGSFERGVGAALGGAETAGFARYPVLVDATSIAPARNVITGLAGASVLAPLDEPEKVRRRQAYWLGWLGAGIALVIALALLARLVA
jgi:hypothetical protein